MPSLPQGLTREQVAELTSKVRAVAGSISGDVRVHGSRADGTARPDSDLDLAILVSAERFEELMQAAFGTPVPGSAKERTMLHARQTGKIQAGEAGLRALRKELEADLGMEVDISIVRLGGPFDRGPYVQLVENPGGED